MDIVIGDVRRHTPEHQDRIVQHLNGRDAWKPGAVAPQTCPLGVCGYPLKQPGR